MLFMPILKLIFGMLNHLQRKFRTFGNTCLLIVRFMSSKKLTQIFHEDI
jgi:hypothetical protein